MRSRHRPRKPARWQLNLFIVVMCALLLALVNVLPPEYETVLTVGWCILMLVGMGVWLWRNEPALLEAEQAKRRAQWEAERAAHWYQAGRTIPLTSVQQRFLENQDARQHHERPPIPGSRFPPNSTPS